MAARYNDAESEDNMSADPEVGLRTTVENHDLDFDVLLYIAEQRAIRIRLIETGRLGEMSRTQAVALSFSREDRDRIHVYTSLYLDSIFLGWRAKEIADAGS